MTKAIGSGLGPDIVVQFKESCRHGFSILFDKSFVMCEAVTVLGKLVEIEPSFSIVKRPPVKVVAALRKQHGAVNMHPVALGPGDDT